MTNGNKKSIIILATVIIIAILALAIFLHAYVFQTATAKIAYSIDTNIAKYYPDQTNFIVIRSSNSGNRAASFYLEMSFTNSSFSNQTEAPYTEVNSTLVKIPFSLDKASTTEEASNKTIFFTIDDNAPGFSFFLSLENRDTTTPEILASLYSLSYGWNETTNCYEQGTQSMAIP
jgi:flagellar basal body-associated protein FliL